MVNDNCVRIVPNERATVSSLLLSVRHCCCHCCCRFVVAVDVIELKRHQKFAEYNIFMLIIEVNYGSIKSISLPEGWREFEVPDEGFAMYTLREFRPAESEDDDVSLCLFNKGLLRNEETGNDFKTILAAKSHHLTARELKLLSDVLNEAADAERFSVLDARTEIINGRSALVIEGRWVNSQTKMIRAYFDVNGDGRCVDEFFFSAPPDQYESLIRDVRKSLSCLEWKSD
jgi:hypothetical protein